MTADSQEADARDMQALQSGEALALNRLMTRWQIPLRAFLFRYTQNEHDALDLAQETFTRIYLHRSRYREGAKFSTWMFQIALNLARDLSRRQKHRTTTSLDEVSEKSDSPAPNISLIDREQIDAVRQAIADLPGELREAVVLFEYEDRSHRDIAEITGATPKAIETRLYRARAQLKEKLARFLAK